MSKNAAFQYWIMSVAPFMFYLSPVVGLFSDWDRTVIAYNLNTDHCYALTTSSKLEAIEAANKGCELAFQALDRSEGNSCDGWQHPACRQLQLPEYDFFQCSCLIPSYTAHDIRIHDVTAFRDCAWKAYTSEILYQQIPAQSALFQNIHQKIYDRAVQRSRLRHDRSSLPRAGASVKRAMGPAASHGYLVCDVCGRHYANKQSFSDHKNSHKKDIRCSNCNRTFSTKGNFTIHNKKFHSNEAELASGPPEPRGPFVCQTCGKSYQCITSLSTHKGTHKEEVRCKYCGIGFSRKFGLQKHIERIHPDLVEAAAADERQRLLIAKPFSCDHCEARFTSKRQLVDHTAVHRGETHCSTCNKTFPRKSFLKAHLRNAHTSSS